MLCKLLTLTRDSKKVQKIDSKIENKINIKLNVLHDIPRILKFQKKNLQLLFTIIVVIVEQAKFNTFLYDIIARVRTTTMPMTMTIIKFIITFIIMFIIIVIRKISSWISSVILFNANWRHIVNYFSDFSHSIFFDRCYFQEVHYPRNH